MLFEALLKGVFDWLAWSFDSFSEFFYLEKFDEGTGGYCMEFSGIFGVFGGGLLKVAFGDFAADL